MNDVVKVLRDYALENYEAGGHWVYETFDSVDYLQALTEAGDLEGAKVWLKGYWSLVEGQKAECAWGD